MKYLIHKETKEHKVLTDTTLWSSKDWTYVEADSEGWIPHTGDVCPLPDDARCEVSGRGYRKKVNPECASNFTWWLVDVYRPILTEKVQEPEPIPALQYDPRSVSFNLLDRLKAAHAQAQTIPDLEAELREVLGGMGYDLVARSPFVEPEPAVETPQGYVLMPLEPTEAMLDAMHDNCFANPEWRKMCGYQKGEEIYKELLAHSRPKGE